MGFDGHEVHVMENGYEVIRNTHRAVFVVTALGPSLYILPQVRCFWHGALGRALRHHTHLKGVTYPVIVLRTRRLTEASAPSKVYPCFSRFLTFVSTFGHVSSTGWRESESDELSRNKFSGSVPLIQVLWLSDQGERVPQVCGRLRCAWRCAISTPVCFC